MGYLRFEAPSTVDRSYDNTLNDDIQPELINLRRVIQTYAWRRYCKSVGFLKRVTKRKRKHFFSINWDDLKFNHFTHMCKAEEDESNQINLAASRLLLSQLDRKSDRHSYMNLDIRTPNVINSVQIENRTDKDGVYVFSTDKDTKAKFAVEFKSCYSLGANTNIELTIPASYVSPTNHVDCRILVSDTFRQRFKETTKWTVDAEIPVQAGQKVNAILSAQEQQTCTEFEVETNLFLDNSWLTVNVHRKRDKSVVYTCFITDLREVFQRYQGQNVCLTTDFEKNKRVSHNITLTSQGVCNILGWSDVEVFVTSEKLQEDKDSIGDVNV